MTSNDTSTINQKVITGLNGSIISKVESDTQVAISQQNKELGNINIEKIGLQSQINVGTATDTTKQMDAFKSENTNMQNGRVTPDAGTTTDAAQYPDERVAKIA